MISGSIFASAGKFLNSVGVCVHLGNKATPYYTNFAAVLPLLHQLGVGHLRDDAYYLTNTTRDTNPYPNIRTLAAQGYAFSLVCADPLSLVLYPQPSLLEMIYGWCNNGVILFEGANEPALTRFPTVNPLISQDHQGNLYRAVKNSAVLKNIHVASPSYIQGSVPLAMDLSAVVDWENIHPYRGMEHPEALTQNGNLFNYIAASQTCCGVKPVVASEDGYHTALQATGFSFPVSEAIKTRYIVRTLLWAFLNGVMRTYLYELMDSFAPDPANPQANFGLADYSGNPKPSFNAVKNVLALTHGPGPVAAGPAWSFTLTADDTSNVQTLLLNRTDGSAVLFVWLGVAGWVKSTQTTLPPVARNAVLALTPSPNSVVGHLFNDDGTQTIAPLMPVTGGYALTISDQLTAIEITL